MSCILSLVLIPHNNPQFRYYYCCCYSNLTDEDTEAKVFVHSITASKWLDHASNSSNLMLKNMHLTPWLLFLDILTNSSIQYFLCTYYVQGTVRVQL